MAEQFGLWNGQEPERNTGVVSRERQIMVIEKSFDRSDGIAMKSCAFMKRMGRFSSILALLALAFNVASAEFGVSSKRTPVWSGPPTYGPPGFEVARQQDLRTADITTHEIRSGDVVLGISDKGGGYINKLYIPGVGDIIGKHAARYGRGGQVSIRDRLHGGRYNPTQAGFTDTAGTISVVEQGFAGRMTIPARPLALWNGDGQYDFTEWEDLAADPYRNDGGDSDRDGIDESSLAGKQAEEITSEFDFAASYRDVRDGTRVKIPAFRFEYELRFIRPPAHAIRQFGKGTPAYDSDAEVPDISVRAPAGKHPSTEHSLTGLILSATLRGDKSIWNPTRAFFVGKDGQLELVKLDGSFRRAFWDRGEVRAVPLVIFATSDNPRSGPAIGFFHPDSHENRFSVLGRNTKDDSIQYEDARTQGGAMLGNDARTDGMWLFGVRTEHTGLLSPKETPSETYESLRGESYILVGTPEEILAGANAIQASR